uniref:ornithine decarboxylase n=1 Tax=Sphaeramia orbicularis TaxID=375764 RepID=A0A672YKR1_9TELE
DFLSLSEENFFVLNSASFIQDSEVPFHVANLDDLHQKHIRWLRTLPRVKPFYAVKCNSTPAVIRMLSTLGTGFDCASKGEIELVLSLGVTPEKIIFAHTTKPQSHIKYASTRGVDMMTFDCEEELLKISACHTRAKSYCELFKLLERCKELDLEVIGVSFHVGSGCTDSLAYRQAIEDARHVFDTAVLLGFQMRLLDIGGGFPGNEGFQIQFDENDRVMMYYISDGVFGSLNCLINDPAHINKRYRSIIWGPTCDSLDRVTATYWMPEVQVGDWLLIDNMGAYTVCCSSDFNGFEKAHIYPVLSAQTWISDKFM